MNTVYLIYGKSLFVFMRRDETMNSWVSLSAKVFLQRKKPQRKIMPHLYWSWYHLLYRTSRYKCKSKLKRLFRKFVLWSQLWDWRISVKLNHPVLIYVLPFQINFHLLNIKMPFSHLWKRERTECQKIHNILKKKAIKISIRISVGKKT